MQLFRQQALDHQNRLYGEIFLVPPLRWQAISLLLFGAVCAAALFLTFGTYSRTIAAAGTLRPAAGIASILVTEAGIVAAMPVEDGAPVRRGQLVALLEPRRRAATGMIELVASRDGILTALHNQPGDALAKGAVYGRIMPRTADWQVALRLPPAAVTRVAAGQAVRITLVAYPVSEYGVLSGVIDHVGAAPVEAAEPYYLVTARLAPLTEQQRRRGLVLRPDMALGARIVLDRRSLLRWMLDPLPAGPPR